MKDVLARYVQEHSNQYPSLMGLPVLRQALARHNKARGGVSLDTNTHRCLSTQTYYNLDVDWQTEVVITVGATEALAAALMGMLNDGDEVCRRYEHCHFFSALPFPSHHTHSCRWLYLIRSMTATPASASESAPRWSPCHSTCTKTG